MYEVGGLGRSEARGVAGGDGRQEAGERTSLFPGLTSFSERLGYAQLRKGKRSSPELCS